VIRDNQPKVVHMLSSAKIVAAVCILLLACQLNAQISGPVEANVGDSQVKMGWGDKSNAPTADELVFQLDPLVNPEEFYYYHAWNWHTWWEANIYRYLKPAKWQPQPLDKDKLPATYVAAENALLKALKEKKHPQVLASIIWALGRMKSTAATSAIVNMLKHPDPIVRRNSWLSLGLIEDELAVQTIMGVLENPELEPEDATAWIVAIGLMDQPDPRLLKAMLPIIKQKNVTQVQFGIPTPTKCFRNEATIQARMAMWTLRMHNPPGVSQFAQQLMPFTTDAILFDEAIQTIASSPDEQIILKLFNPIYHSRISDYRKLPHSFSVHGYHANDIPGFIGIDVITHYTLPSLRTSAAIAYDNPALLTHSDASRLIHLTCRQLSRSYAKMPHNSEWTKNNGIRNGRPNTIDMFKFDHWRYQNPGGEYLGDDIGFALRFGLIPLGNLGDRDLDARDDPEVARLLCDILLGKYTEPAPKRSKRIGDPIQLRPAIPSKYDPSRGFAAIALGIYTQRMPANLSSIRHDKTKDIARYIERLLTRTAQDNDEPLMLRSACALALGIGGSETANDQLIAILSQSPPPIVGAYAVLALGMLGDQRTPILVHKAFEKTADEIDLAKIRTAATWTTNDNLQTLSQRVLVQALACVGNPDANRMLYPYVGENLYTSHQIVRAMKWSTGPQDQSAWIELLNDSGKAKPVEVASFSAWALGELNDALPFSKAHHRLLKNRNITLVCAEYNTVTTIGVNNAVSVNYQKVDTLRPYLQLTNTYLFEAMIGFPTFRK
jgi:HEAT repeat protein